jgi:secreted trypsin-like serine protease
VLTAAHCFFDEDVLKTSPLYVGGNGTSRSGTEVNGEAGYIHPLYDPVKFQAYDFAVIQLPQAFPDIPLMNLNTERNFPRERDPLTIFGFGVVNEGDHRLDAPVRMQEATVPMITDCLPYYSSDSVIDEIAFCAGDMPGGGKDACQGDSGGPIVDENGTQVGLVRYTQRECFG